MSKSLSRFAIYARRNENEKWTDWTGSDDLHFVRRHILIIRHYGYHAKVVDRLTGKEALYGV